MKEKIIAIFDIGKTNKKVLLFNQYLKLVSESEKKFAETQDDDGFKCDNIELIEKWIRESVIELVHSEVYELIAINFTTYGATLVYLDAYGRRLTPVYNYLKPIDEYIPMELYKMHGGKDEFCRRTASPALGMLNSGMQIFWLKKMKTEIFSKVKHILHLPQYLSYLLTGKVYSEHTSIGCHTALWDFDNMAYHPWVKSLGITLSQPIPTRKLNEVVIAGKKILVGIGIHDSSASLVPYFIGSQGQFVLVSSGTWCINMNPFNNENLTSEELAKDCLCYLSITQKPVKSSRLFLGHFHETGEKLLNRKFKTAEDNFKMIKTDSELLSILKDKFKDHKIFFKNMPGSREFNNNIDLSVFKSYHEGYHQLMIELCGRTIEAVDLVIPEYNEIKNIFITGGFSKNALFIKMIASAYPDKEVFTSEVKNASALGTALVILNSLYQDKKITLDLSLKKWGH